MHTSECLRSLVGSLQLVASPFIAAFMPRGFAAAIVPERPMGFDAVVTLLGFVLLVCVVVAMGAPSAVRATTPIRRERRSRPTRRSMIFGAVSTRTGCSQRSADGGRLTGGPASADSLAKFHFDGRRRSDMRGKPDVSRRSRPLQRTPSLMGWNWDAGIGFEPEAAPLMPAILAELTTLEGIQQVTPGTLYPPTFLGVPGTEITVWPWSFGTGPQAITPTMLSGRAPDGPDEVAIDRVFAQASGLGVGDSVSLSRPAMVSHPVKRVPAAPRRIWSRDTAVGQPDDPPIAAMYEITGFAVLPIQRTGSLPAGSVHARGFGSPCRARRGGGRGRHGVGARRPSQPRCRPRWPSSCRTRRSRTGVSFLRFSGDLQTTADAISRIEGVGEIVRLNPEQVLTIGIGLNLTDHHRVPRRIGVPRVQLGPRTAHIICCHRRMGSTVSSSRS